MMPNHARRPWDTDVVAAHGNDPQRCGRCSEAIDLNEPMIVEYLDADTGDLYDQAIGPLEQPMYPAMISGAFHIDCHRAVVERRERFDLSG
jgi:hypothetical protein